MSVRCEVDMMSYVALHTPMILGVTCKNVTALYSFHEIKVILLFYMVFSPTNVDVGSVVQLPAFPQSIHVGLKMYFTISTDS